MNVRALALVFAVALLGSSPAPARAAPSGTDALDRQIAASRAAYARANERARQAAQRSERMEAESTRLRNASQQAQRQAAVLAARVQAAEAALAASEQRYRIATQLRRRQSALLRRQQAPLMDLLARQQLLLRRPPVSLFAEPGSASRLVHARMLAEAMLPTIRARTQRLRAALARSRQLANAQQAALNRLRSDRITLAGRRAALAREGRRLGSQAARLGGRAGLEADVASVLASRTTNLEQVMAAAARRAAERDRLAQMPGPVPRPGTVRGGLAGMVARATRSAPRFQPPVMGDVVRGMGSVDEAGVASRGILIAAPAGAQVVAPAEGRVLFAGPFRSYGQVVILDHGNSWTSLVTGMIALQVRQGDALIAGVPLGRAPPNNARIGVELRHRGRLADFAAAVQ